MTISYRQGRAHPTTTLVTFNHYVDRVTGANRIERWSGQRGSLRGGEGVEPVLYWKEDLKPKSKIKILISWVGSFFYGRVSPRASHRIYANGSDYLGRRKK